MKKILLAALLTLSSVSASNAAVITRPATTLTLDSGININFTEANRTQYFEFATTGTTELEFSLTSPPPSSIIFTLFEDTDPSNTNGAVTFDDNIFTAQDGFLLFNFRLFGATVGNTSETLSLPGATNWVLRLTLDNTPEGRATMTVNSVPVPAAAWLFGTGLVGLAGLRRKLAA